jgi:hypothetical protein
VDFREFRHGSPPPLRSPRLLPPLEVSAPASASGSEHKQTEYASPAGG